MSSCGSCITDMGSCGGCITGLGNCDSSLTLEPVAGLILEPSVGERNLLVLHLLVDFCSQSTFVLAVVNKCYVYLIVMLYMHMLSLRLLYDYDYD